VSTYTYPFILIRCLTQTSIDQKRLDEVVGEIQTAGGDAIGIPGDVAAEDFPKKIVDATVKLVKYVFITVR